MHLGTAGAGGVEFFGSVLDWGAHRLNIGNALWSILLESFEGHPRKRSADEDLG